MLGLSARSLSDLAARGIAVKAARGQYVLTETVRNYCRHLRDQAAGRGGDAGATLAAERAREARERADNLALKNAQMRGELVSAAEVEQVWTSILSAVRAALLAVPPRLQSRLPHLTARDTQAIDAEIRDALQEVSE